MRLLSGTVLLCLALSAAFAAAPPAKVPAEWLALIDQLGDDDSKIQDSASKKLEALGEDVLPALRRAAKAHDDVDARLRCKLLVTAIEKNEYREVRPTASASCRAAGTPTASRSRASGTSAPARRSTS
jgi:hypothetical protein